MQRAVVLHHQTLTGLQPENQFQLGAFQDTAKLDVGRIPVLGQFGWRVQPVGRPVVEMHTRDGAVPVHGDERLLRHQVGLSIGIVKRHWQSGQQLKCHGIFLPQYLGRGKAIHQQRVATGRLALQTMQQLHTGRRMAIRVIRMHAQPHGGVSQVGWIGNRLHVKQPPVIGHPHKAQPVAHLGHGARLGRHILEQAKPQSRKPLQPRQLGHRIGHHGGPVTCWQAGGHVTTPKLDLWSARSPCLLRQVMCDQPVLGVRRTMPVRPDHLEGLVLGQKRLAWRQLPGQINNFVEFLAIARMAAQRTRAVVAQPVGPQVGDLPQRPRKLDGTVGDDGTSHFAIQVLHQIPLRYSSPFSHLDSRRATQMVAALINSPPMMALSVGTSLNSSQPISADHTSSRKRTDCVAEISAFWSDCVRQ